MARRIAKTSAEEKAHLRRRYAGKLVRLFYDERHFAGYWTGEIPSVNDLTLDVHKIKRRAPTMQVKIFKQAVYDWLARYAAYFPKYMYFELDIAVWFRMYVNHTFNLVMRDVSNFIKISEDSICQAVGVDDRFNLDVMIHKRDLPQGQEPHWAFVLTGRNQVEHESERNFNAIAFKRHAEDGAGFVPEQPAEDRRRQRRLTRAQAETRKAVKAARRGW